MFKALSNMLHKLFNTSSMNANRVSPECSERSWVTEEDFLCTYTPSIRKVTSFRIPDTAIVYEDESYGYT
jgi:hypothetical protein